MTVFWLDAAERSLDAQIDHIAQDNPRAALDQADAVYLAVGRLAQFPESGRQGRVPGTRELVVPGTPFIVVYRTRRSEVSILRVLHGAQRWPARRATT